MNYLAHLLLSQHDTNLMVGNYIADFVKGKRYEEYSEGIKRGILMHRDIDSFTDSHDIPMRTKERLFPKYGKYSSVLVDMFYDHVLSKEWSNYSPLSLDSFTSSAYRVLKSHQEVFPPKASRILDYMSAGNWLLAYSKIDGMAAALNGISRRASFENNMDEAIIELKDHYDIYKKDFEEYFPLLIKHLRPYYNEDI